MEKQGCVYLLSNKNNTVLYVGVTSDLHRRVWQHKNKSVKGFTEKYNCEKLVWYECTDSIETAIEREKQIKAGPRNAKQRLVEQLNPLWGDLAGQWYE